MIWPANFHVERSSTNETRLTLASFLFLPFLRVLKGYSTLCEGIRVLCGESFHLE